jgi:hypothetical protein
VPDFVHVLAKGRIVLSGGPELAVRLEKEGYGPVFGEAGFPDEAQAWEAEASEPEESVAAGSAR